MYDVSLRLHLTVAAQCPILGISIGTVGVSSSVTFVPAPSATLQQIANAQTAINAFDWSKQAEDSWENLQFRTDAKNYFSDVVSEYKLLRALMLVILDEVNVIRGNLIPALAARTASQLRTAIINKIDSGSADQ